LKKERRELAAVMRLVIEEVRHRKPQRIAPRLRVDDARVRQLAGEGRLGESRGPPADVGVGLASLVAPL